MLFPKTSLTFKRCRLINKNKTIIRLNNRKPAYVVNTSSASIVRAYNYLFGKRSFNTTLFFYNYFLAQLFANTANKKCN